MIKKVLIVSITALFFLACDQSKVLYQSNYSFTKKWDKNKAVIFNLNKVFRENSQEVNTFLNLRHNNDYPYKNIWFFVETKFPNGLVKIDTLEYYLSDDRGKWNGIGMGEIKENLFVLNHSQFLEKQDSVIVSIKHGMRDSLLIGVEDLTLVIEKSN